MRVHSRKVRAFSGKVVAFSRRAASNYAKISAMDDIDRKILAVLQEDGRLTITELADRIPLSVSRCQRRLRELESQRVVRGYRAEVDAAMVGLGFRAIVFVRMQKSDSQTVADFEHAVAAVPEVVSAQRLFGDPDYLLHVVAADLAAYRRVYDERLGALPGVQRLTSTLVMKEVVADRGLPLRARW
jgi:DNA-binding Lrp family transcriptional regulator